MLDLSAAEVPASNGRIPLNGQSYHAQTSRGDWRFVVCALREIVRLFRRIRRSSYRQGPKFWAAVSEGALCGDTLRIASYEKFSTLEEISRVWG